MARLNNENVNHIEMETKDFQIRLVTDVDYLMPLIVLYVYVTDWKKLVNK